MVTPKPLLIMELEIVMSCEGLPTLIQSKSLPDLIQTESSLQLVSTLFTTTL